MPATSLSSLITDLVASMESSVTSLREHHRAEQAVRRLMREAHAHDAGAGAGDAAPGAAALAGTRLRQKCPEQAGGDECGVAIDHPVAERACAVR